MTKPLQVKFLKGVAELKGPFGGHSRVYITPDNDAFLMASETPGHSTRYHFHGGDVSGAFTDEKRRAKYMDTINKAAGEVVCVPAEAA